MGRAFARFLRAHSLTVSDYLDLDEAEAAYLIATWRQDAKEESRGLKGLPGVGRGY